MTNPSQVIVVGAGLAGLAAGWRLAKRGVHVVVLERGVHPGGRLRGEMHEGFHLTPGLGALCEADRRLSAFVKEVGLGEEWLPLRAVSTAVAQGEGVRDVSLRGPLDVRGIPGVGLRQGLRLLRLPRLMSRYADALDFEDPAAAVRLDDRSLADFGRLYFGPQVLDRWLAPRAVRAAPGDAHEMSRVQFLVDERRPGSARMGLPRTTLDEVFERVAQFVRVRTETRVREVRSRAEGVLVVTDAGAIEADAVVIATDAAEAESIASPGLESGERDHLRGVRYQGLLAVAAGLCRPATSRPREIWVPASEGSPLERVLLEPGVRAGRVPGGLGLGWLRARDDYRARAVGLPDDVVSKALLEACDRLMPGWARTVDWSRVFRVERFAPRFDVGHYRALARFEAVQRDRRENGRRLYFAGDHLIHPSAEGAVVSGEKAAQAVAEDLGLA